MQLAVEIIIHHFAILNADDPFRLRRNPIIMCNENHGAALLAELMQDAHDLLAGMGIKVAGRLVGQNDRGRASTARAIATRCCWPPDISEGR